MSSEPIEEGTAPLKVNSAGEGPAFTFTALSDKDRAEIVELTTRGEASAFLTVSQLELSALGASVVLYGTWTEKPLLKPSTSLTNWQETSSYGRTMHAVVVHTGFLFPLGHRATKIEILQRVIAQEPQNASSDPHNYPVAYLQLQTFYNVVEPVKAYPATGQPNPDLLGATSDWPFSSVRMVTLMTPPVESPQLLDPTGGLKYGEWPRIAKADFLWRFVATDLAGNDVHFAMPLAWVESSSAVYDAEMLKSVNAYNATGAEPGPWSKTACGTGGAPMRFAPEVGSAGVGGTTHPTLGIQLGAATSEYDPYSAQPNVSGPGPTRLTEVAQPNFYPTIRGASIRLHAVEHLTGTSLDDNSPGPLQAYGGTRFHFYPTYVALGSSSFGGNAVGVSGSLIRAEAVRDGASGLLPNPNSVYAEAENQLGSQLGMNLPTSAVGALGNPSTAIAGLSAEIGAIGGQLTNAKGQTEAQLKQAKEELEKQLREVASEYEKTAAEYKKKAEEYFKAFEEKVEGEAKAIISELLGSLNLGDIVKGFTSLPASALGALPQAKVRTDVTREGLVPAPPPLPALPTPPKLPSIKSLLNKELGSPTIEYGMAAELQAYPEDNPVFEPEEGGLLTLVTVVKKKEANAAAPTYSVKGTISPFKIYLLQKNGGTAFIELSFETLTFSAGSQGKPSLDVKLAGVAFIGDLTFIQTLEEYLQSLGAGDLAINVEPTQISIGTTLSLPSQEVGVFTLSGLSFSGSLELPLLSGEATAAFAFASKENPFTLTVCCFGGGGFAALELGFKGVRAVQAQFEFAGALALNVGVASGSVNLAAGIYFKYSDAHGVKLSGFVRITGQVQILGIVTISAEVNLTLEYSGHAATGTATVRASISVCGFSKSVSFTVSKSFGGSSSSANAIRAGGTHRARLGASPDHAAPPELSWENLFPGDSWSEYANAFSRTVVT